MDARQNRPLMTDAARTFSPLPPVERLRPGLWSIPVPIPSSSLRYVFVYAFETDAGPYIVDTGWNTDDAFAALSSGLAHIGFEVSDVKGVLVTHIHADHYGLAGRVREASGAWVGLHPADAALIHDRYEEPDDLLANVGNWLRRIGAPEEELAALRDSAMPVRPYVNAVKPDRLVEDGDRPEIPGWDVTAIWTPGHSPGHLCFWEGKNKLFLAGDHVLPRITPNISYNPQSSNDPLGQFLDSLEKVRHYDAEEVLPAHEHRFVGLSGRIDELKQHHEHRFVEVLTAIGEGVTDAWHIAERMRWSRPWNRIEGFMRRAAVGECIAHLKALESRGLVREAMGEPSRWELVTPE